MIREHAAFTVNDDVQYVERAKYDDVLKTYLDYLGGLAQVASVYQLGNISVPGISDIDLIVVLRDEHGSPVNLREAQRAITGPTGMYLFSHAPYVVDRNTFADLPMLFFADNLRHQRGETLTMNRYPQDQADFYNYVIALEAAISQSLAFIRAMHNRTIFNLRSLLCNLNAVKHNFTTLAPWRQAGQRPAWREYRTEIDELRNVWFQENEAARVHRAIDLSGRASTILW